MAAYLSIRNVVKSYDGAVNAVDDISIDVEKGEFITFLGPSGSGKTTTLVTIAGFEEPTSGEILLEGRDLTRLKPWDRNIGMVFQNYALFPHMTVARNVEFPLRMRGVPKAESRARVGAVLDLVGLGTYAERHPRELSGGQQQRVALARGLVFDPDLLLLDEPLGALDKNLREQMQVEIKRIHREVGITMVYVTHDQTEAMTMSNRIAVFSRGKLEQVAVPLEVYHRPRTRFVGEFVGDSNFFHGRVENGGSGTLTVEGIGPIKAPPGQLAGAKAGDAFDIMVRPERLRVVEGALPVMNTVLMAIDTIVNYGDSLMVIGNAERLPLRMRIAGEPPTSVVEGATVWVGWMPGEAHLIQREERSAS
jgi:putative spermidine/putrescine transport system ATP-binding protein